MNRKGEISMADNGIKRAKELSQMLCRGFETAGICYDADPHGLNRIIRKYSKAVTLSECQVFRRNASA